MKLLILLGGVCALTFATPPKPKTAKTPPAKPKVAGKAVPVKTALEASPLEQADKICRRDLAWGKLDAVRARCADLDPANSAIATFWRLTLSDDPNDLRKGFAPVALAKVDVDARLLLLGGRYHFARGQIREMEDLVEMGRKAKLKGPDIDTLKLLAQGG